MDGDKIKEFFIFHVEKMILGVVVAISGFMVYKGLDQENIMELHQPDKLTNDANQVRAEVDEDHNDQILPERIPDFDIDREINRRRTAVNPKGYQPFGPLSPTNIASTIRRKDPVLFAPLGLQMHSMIASIAVRSSKEEWPLKDLEGAEPPERKEEVKKPKPRSRRGRGGGGEMEEMMEEMMMGDEMEEMMEMSAESYGGAEGMATGGGSKRRLNREHDFGFRPMNTKHMKTDATQYPVPAMGLFITGSAVVPYKALYESYEKAFAETDTYDPRKRDRPIFLNMKVQRADVTNKSIDELQEADWIDRDDVRRTAFDAAAIWAGFAPEVVHGEYRDSKLTMWLPPIMLDDYTKIATHPLIPKIPWREVLEKQKDAANPDDPDEPLDIGMFEFDNGAARQFDNGGGMDMMMDEGGMMGGGMPGMMGAERFPPEYKLIRFHDFYKNPERFPNSPLPGHKYVYRVAYAVDNPNFPTDPFLQPKGSSLNAAAYAKFSELAARAIQEKKRDSQRWSQWSEPSAPISLPGSERIYVGPVKASEPRPYTAGNRTVMYTADKPKASVVVSKFNDDYRTFAPMLMENITPGTVLSKEAEVGDIVDPITLEVKKLEEPKVVSRSTVIDIDGGVPLGIQEGDGMVVPGLMLLFDESGNLKVHDEVTDQESYRIQSFAEERGE